MTKIIFNTFCTEKWMPLASVLADSILEFSKYELVINCINFDYVSNNPRIIAKKIKADIKSLNSLYRYKWSTILDQDFDMCIMLDADMIALPYIDEIVDDTYDYRDEPYPLFAPHPHDPFTNPMHSRYLSEMMKIFTDKTPAMKYVYASGIIFKKQIHFIKEMVGAIDWFNVNNIPAYIEDEGILNCLLSKYSVSKNLPYNYFPNYTLHKDYLANNLEHSKELYDSYLRNGCSVKFCSLHGCKNPELAKQILTDTISNRV